MLEWGRIRRMKMPLYDWECEICHHQFEEILSSTDVGCLCPMCGARAEKIITKMPLRSYSKRPQDRLWGTSHISSSEKFKEKQKRKGGK
jgi:putative FmdB family regulatory protein